MLHESVAAAVKNRWLVIIAAILVMLLGVWAYTQLFIDAYPDISQVMVQISTTYPGRAAEEVEQEVTIPIERVMAGVPKVEIIRSRSIFGLSLVQLNFEPGVEDYWSRNVVFQKMSEFVIPPEASPSMGSLSTAYGEIYRYQLVGDKDHDSMELRTLQDWVVTPRLLRAQGVAELDNFGGRLKQFAVLLDKDKLVRYGVKLQDVNAAIQSNNSSGGGSILQRGSTAMGVRGIGRLRQLWDFTKIFVKNSNGTQVYLRDVAEAKLGHAPLTGIFGKDDTDDGVEGIVRMRRGENPSETLKNIEEAVKELNEGGLPKGVRIETFYNRTTLIEQTLHTVAHNTVMGILLVLGVLFVFLGNPMVAAIVATTIPFALLFALLAMKLINIPISLLSIGTVDFGIIVDGAIIVLENVVRRLAEQTPEERKAGFIPTLLDATKQVQEPMFYSMFIVITAYLPLLLLRHIEGQLFRPLAITLCCCLIAATLFALYVVPVLATFAFRNGKVTLHENPLFTKMQHGYDRLLPKIIQNRWKVFGSAAVVMVLVIFGLFPKLGTEFLPYMDEGSFWIRASFPEGISLQENAYYASQMRKILHEFQEVAWVTSQTGRSDDGLDPFPGNRVEMDVGLKPRGQWKEHRRKLDLEADMRSRLHQEFPTTRFNFTQPIIDSVTEDTNGTSANLAVEIVGPDLDELRDLAEQTAQLLRRTRGGVDVAIEQEGPQPQLRIRIGRTRLSRYQLTADAVMGVINSAVGGQPVSTLYENDRRFDIVVKYAPKYIWTPQAISRLPVFNDNGEPIPLGQVTTIEVVDGQTLIARADSKRRVTVRCDIRGRAQGDYVADAQKRFAQEIKLPAGYSVAWVGMFENLARAEKHFELLLPLTILIIFALLFYALHSLPLAGRIMFDIPFSMIGSTIALWLRGMHLNVSVAVGLTTLFGLATMHGHVMVSCIRELRDKGLGIEQAILKGASLRLRPIIMTAVAAMLGLFPMSIATGIGSDVQRPIATVIVWGIFSSVILNLFVLPALFHIIEIRKKS